MVIRVFHLITLKMLVTSGIYSKYIFVVDGFDCARVCNRQSIYQHGSACSKGQELELFQLWWLKRNWIELNLWKSFDANILTRYGELLAASNLQFGFKLGYSTSTCSMRLNEMLEHYRRNGSTVYCTMLDATNAFDRVEYCKLVRWLLIKKLPPVIIRLLLQINLFNFSPARNGTFSKRFRVTNWVWQGAILSPILFCVFFWRSFGKPSSNEDGLFIGLFFVGELAYVDDLVLLAPSASAMQCMLNICDVCAAQYNVIFNAKKSKCLRCYFIGTVKHTPRSTCNPSVSIGPNCIEFVDKWPLLRHIIMIAMIQRILPRRRQAL